MMPIEQGTWCIFDPARKRMAARNLSKRAAKAWKRKQPKIDKNHYCDHFIAAPMSEVQEVAQ